MNFRLPPFASLSLGRKANGKSSALSKTARFDLATKVDSTKNRLIETGQQFGIIGAKQEMAIQVRQHVTSIKFVIFMNFHQLHFGSHFTTACYIGALQLPR